MEPRIRCELCGKGQKGPSALREHYSCTHFFQVLLRDGQILLSDGQILLSDGQILLSDGHTAEKMSHGSW